MCNTPLCRAGDGEGKAPDVKTYRISGTPFVSAGHRFEFVKGIELMKSRETVVQLRRFDVEEKQRKVADLENMIAEFGRMASDLEQQIAAEETRAGVTDPSHFSYPPFAKAAAQRRDNLATSIQDLMVKFDLAQGELEQAREVYRKAQQREERRQDSSSGPKDEITVAAASRSF